ncbi:hypothetical protein AB0M43_04680 [Longispora sp. NPDC051575]|uniref:hypothetical protein n=1 Tax=Longispora sp. NPDC051575 TaxID=3154943 RepID=UPI00341CD4E6
MLVAAIVAVLATAGLVAVLVNKGDSPGATGPQPTWFSSAGKPTLAGSTSPSSPGSSTGATSAPSASPSGRAPEGAATTPPRAIADYYALMPGDTQAGYARLSDRFKQDRARSYGDYQAFWGQIRSVTATEVTAVDERAVSATITYTTSSGETSQERHVYGLVQVNGQWVIDSQRMA